MFLDMKANQQLPHTRESTAKRNDNQHPPIAVINESLRQNEDTTREAAEHRPTKRARLSVAQGVAPSDINIKSKLVVVLCHYLDLPETRGLNDVCQRVR